MVRANALAVSGWRPLFDAAAPRAEELQHGARVSFEAELDHSRATSGRRICRQG
jgi:homoserine kinase type II